MSKTNSDSIVNVPTREIYGNKVRARVCGICRNEHGLLLVNHFGLYGRDFWSPPGGGIEFGQDVVLNLQREFREETGLEVEVGSLRFVCEFIRSPLHAIELFFDTRIRGGTLKTGRDPEVTGGPQIIRNVKFVGWKELESMPLENLHGALATSRTWDKIQGLNGYLKI